MTSVSGAGLPLEWQFLQCFGERAPNEEIQEADIISAVEFDHDGRYLATGDKGGRVVLFDAVPSQQRAPGPDVRAPPPSRLSAFEYKYLTEFQSHEPEFDYLKSLEIEEKINVVKWCRTSNNTRMVLASNDKTIKLWKIAERKVTNVTNFNLEHKHGNGPLHTLSPRAPGSPASGMRPISHLKIPQVQTQDVVYTSRCKRVYGNAHTYHINSLSVNSDQETFLSADDLRLNLWNFNVSDQSFNIVDIKPTNMEDLTEVITSAEFHPTHCHTFAYSSSKGSIRLADMRSSALCDKHAKAFEEPDPSGQRSFFSEIIASISDICFSRNGRYILSRDYMTVKLWDVNMESSPVATFYVHEQLRSQLCDLYENDSIFDKFNCTVSGDGNYIATGSYSNMFKLLSQGSPEVGLEASRDPMRRRLQAPARNNRFGLRKGGGTTRRNPGDELSTDFSSKLLHLAWHPEANVIACASSNSLYMFCAP